MTLRKWSFKMIHILFINKLKSIQHLFVLTKKITFLGMKTIYVLDLILYCEILFIEYLLNFMYDESLC